MKNKSMKTKIRNAISKKNIKKSFRIIFENITRKKNQKIQQYFSLRREMMK